MLSLVIVVIGFVAACSAVPSVYVGGAPTQHYPVIPVKSQYHTQNELGQYAYGYNDGFSTKSETKHANGLTEGAYSYVDPNGVLQQYQYVSDENGYRVTGTNLPAAPAPAAPAVPADGAQLPQQVEDTPEVAAAKAAHQVAYDAAKQAADAAPADEPSAVEVGVAAVSVDSAAAVAPTAAAALPVAAAAAAAYHGYRPTAYGAYAPAPIASYAYAAPSYAYAAPVPSYAYAAPSYAAPSYAYAAPSYAAPSYAYAPYAVGPYSSVHSQYHAQDEFGQYSYGYNSGSSSKAEVKTLDGVTRGGYSYVDPNGIYQQYQYVSDPVNGFRVTGTNLPSNSL